jgi:hypothetical protein
VERIDRIPLLVFVSSTLLLAGVAWALPAGPTGLASICRSRLDDAAAKPAPPGPARPATRSPS